MARKTAIDGKEYDISQTHKLNKVKIKMIRDRHDREKAIRDLCIAGSLVLLKAYDGKLDTNPLDKAIEDYRLVTRRVKRHQKTR